MKFEKFFKSVGTHGLIVKESNGTPWLVCAGVGMRIPEGVNNLGVSVDPTPVFSAIVSSEPDGDFLGLKDAILPTPDGKAKDIIRVFETLLGDRVGICNADFGLLEKSDRLTYLEVEDDETMVTAKFAVVRDHADEVIGYINGVDVQ